MISKRLAALLLVLALLVPQALLAQEKAQQVRPRVAPLPSVALSSAPVSSQQSPQPVTARPRAVRPSYEREPRRRHGISKQEMIFLGAIAGTSMGIGALAAGAKGLAIGSIVGGWGAYLGHRLWKHL